MTEEEREQWQAMLRPTPQCPDVPDLQPGGTHEAACPNCQAELALMQAFARPPAAHEQQAVQAIVSQLRGIDWAAGLPQRKQPWWAPWLRPKFLAGASAALACALVLATAIQLNYRGETVADPHVSEAEAVRSQELETVSPTGAVASVPAELRWKEVPGAHSYRVRLMEVDKSVLWTAEVPGASAPLPGDARKYIVPAKGLLWDVTALSAGGTEISRSGLQTFTLNLQ